MEMLKREKEIKEGCKRCGGSGTVRVSQEGEVGECPTCKTRLTQDGVTWIRADVVQFEMSNLGGELHLEKLNNPMHYLNDDGFEVSSLFYDEKEKSLLIIKKRLSDEKIFKCTFTASGKEKPFNLYDVMKDTGKIKEPDRLVSVGEMIGKLHDYINNKEKEEK